MKRILLPFFIISILIIVFIYSCSTEEEVLPDSLNVQTPEPEIQEVEKISFNFAAHDVSNIAEISENIFTVFSSGNNTGQNGVQTPMKRLRYFTLNLNNENPKWELKGAWDEGAERDDFWWHTQWMEEYDYDSNVENEHNNIIAVAPSLLDANTVYFQLYNNPGRRWALSNGLEDAMFGALYRANATGNYPNQEWNMEPIPIYYSNNITFDRGGPRAIDNNIWKDTDNQLYMTFGSWDPADQNVIVIADMDENTGRIEGFDQQTPGFYEEGGLDAFHTVATFGEGAFSYHKDDYYYLFLSLGGCCIGLDSTYYTVVGRSENIYGPYLDKEGRSFSDTYPRDVASPIALPGTTLMSGLLGETKYIGPGHPGIKEINGRLCFSFHYYDGEDNGVPKMGTRELKFDDSGWPYIVSEEEFNFIQ